jgi:hypothetical protein
MVPGFPLCCLVGSGRSAYPNSDSIPPKGFGTTSPCPKKSPAPSSNGPRNPLCRAVGPLLLNPLALWDLADRIDYFPPTPYWWQRMGTAGRELVERYGLKVPIPGLDD